MDQGSYSRPDGRGQPSLPGSSASNNNYQVNVSRQKTKKWVEAKTQNYDGDDWGADEYDDDDEVEPPLPLSPHGPQYGASQGAPNVPSLHIQTNPTSQPQQHQPYPPPQSRPPPATAQPREESSTPVSAHPSSAVPPSAGGFQPQSASSTYPLSPRSPPDSLPSNTPQAATAGKPLPFVRPSDIYRRMEEEKSRGSSESSRPSGDFGSSLSKQTSASPARTAAEPVKPQPPTAPVPAPRTDSHTSVYQDLTRSSVSQAPQHPLVTSPRSEPRVSGFATLSRDVAPAATSEEAKRLSTSPKLPDLARMSVFGADFFSGGFTSSLSSEQIAEQNIPEVPRVAPELKVDRPATHAADASPAEASKASTDKTEATPAAPAAMEKAPIEHDIITPTVYQPPAVTAKNPEPAVPATPADHKLAADPAKQAVTRSSIDTASSSHSAASATDITPTKPLNVRKDESPVRFEPPPPLQREPTFGTDTSSPVKESDALRDEIIKTLNSPSQPSREGGEVGPVDSSRKGSQGHARDSTYTLQDYDSYWDDTDTVPKTPSQPVQPQSKTMSIVPEEAVQTVAAVPSETHAAQAPEPSKPIEEAMPPTTLPAVNPAVVATATPQVSTSQSSASPAVSQASKSASAQQHPEESIISPVSGDLRRRFSWEAEDASKQPPTAAAAGAAPAIATDSPHVPASAMASPPTQIPAAASPHVPAIATASPPAPAIATASTATHTAATASPLVPAPVAAPALAVAAAAVPPTEPKAQPELTSPRASGASAPNAASFPSVAVPDSNSQEPKRLSLADEKALSTTTSNEVSAPPDEHPALRLSDPAPAPVLSMPRSSGASVTPFKDIVSLNNPSERVAKFNETRVAFAVMDIGLDQWLTSLYQDHPEHHSKSFNSYQPPVAVPAGAPAGAQPIAQQPYYQQYLNASAPGSGPAPGRRIGGITMPTNVGGSTFGHSGNQIGTKSKELMQSAGKMGKGLFSKGKNKLRGDKADANPPPVQAKAKHDRSGSWAVLSNKLRTEFPASKQHGHSQHPEEEHSAAPRPSMTIAPQIPEPEPVSPLLREASPDKSLPPAQTQPAARGNGHAANSMPAAAPSTFHVPPSSQIRMVPSEPTHGPISAGAPAVPRPAAEDSGIGMLTQPDESSDAPKRQSSFVGLPPIRRSSTFGLKSKTRRAAERFPIDEEEGNDVPDLPTSDVMENAVREAEAPPQPHRERPTATRADPSFHSTDKDVIVVQHQAVSPEHSPERLARQPAMAPPPQHQPMRQPAHSPMLMHPGQSGPWKLEESHLAEPLHQAKNRSGHSPISPPMGYGFEKETGSPAAMAPPPVPAGMRQRTPDVPPSSAQRYPGLFARPDQESQQQQTAGQPYYEEIVNPRHSFNEYSLPGVGPPTEDRGRAKRNSGIFREIGDKIVRATSRDRKNSFAENRTPVDVHTDGASDSSFGMEEVPDRKKRRSSFLNTLTGRTSVDQGPRQSFNALQRSQIETFPQSSAEDTSSTRKRSMLGGVMAGFGVNRGAPATAPTSGLGGQQMADDEPQLTPKKKRFSAITKAFQRPNQDRPSSGMSLEPAQSASSSQGQSSRSGIFSSVPFRNNDRVGSAGQMDPAGHEHSRRSSFSNLLSTLAGNKGHQHEQQPVPPPKDIGGFPSNDMPQNIPPAPPQAHPADSFPTPNRSGAPASTLPNQFLDRSRPLFAADENNWGINRPPTSTTVTASDSNVDAAGSITSDAATAPAINKMPMPANVSAKRSDSIAPSEISDSETDYAKNARKPSDVTPSVTSRDDEEIGDMTRQDTNVSQMTPNIVTDGLRFNDQQRTPTSQYPNSPGGYFAHNNMMPLAAPLSAGAQGYPKGQPLQHPQDPRRSLTGDARGQGMGQTPPGPYYGQRTQQPMQYANQQQQQQRHMQPSVSQPVHQGEGTATSSKGWKNLKTKMAGQMASMGQSSPTSKSERGDKPAPGDKLFNAFKRLSKQQGSVEAQQQGGRESAGSHLSSRNQSQPVVAQPVVAQPRQLPPQHMQHQQMPPQQMHMGQGFHPAQAPPPQHMPMYMQQRQQQQQQQPQGEPRYSAVPIPQGYTAVYSHGSSQVPSVYNVGHQYSQHQAAYQQQQNYPTHDQPYSAVADSQQQGNGPTPTQAQSPQLPHPEHQPEAQPQEHHSQRPSMTGSELLSPVSTTQRSGSVALSPVSDEPRSPHAALTREALAQQDARKDSQGHLLHPDEGRTSLGPSNSNRVSQVSIDSGRHGASPESEHSPAVSHKQLQAVTSPASPDNKPRAPAASASPPMGTIPDIVSPGNGAASTEAAIIPPATLTSDLTGESKGHVSDDSLEKQAKLRKTSNTITTMTTAATEHVVELEDTAEARQRTLRMDGQEEKIVYDPEEENPKMTATSYPGQEWNPYGEPGFSEWQE